MSDSQTGLQLRQRGLAVAVGGVVIQLIGVLIVIGDSGWTFMLLPVLVSGAASALSYVSVKDHTGASIVAAVITAILTLIAAISHSGGAGVVLAIIGAVVLHFGNKQLVAGIRF